MNNFYGFPAWLYTALWPVAQEGRLALALKDAHLKFLFNFHDYPTPCALEFKDGTFSITVLSEDEAAISKQNLENNGYDGYIYGKFDDFVKVSYAIWQFLKVLLLRRLKIGGKRQFLRLLQIITYQVKKPTNATVIKKNGRDPKWTPPKKS